MGWREFVAVAAVLWIVGCGSLSQLQTEQLGNESDHELKMVVKTDIFETKGKFSLEFKGSVGCNVGSTRNDPTFVEFERLEIIGETISIVVLDGKETSSFQEEKYFFDEGEFLIENDGRTELTILSGREKAEELQIRKIEGTREESKITIRQQEKQLISLGAYSKVYLDSSENWHLELEGDFEILDRKTGKPITQKRSVRKVEISFEGPLSIEDPKVIIRESKESKKDFLCLEVELYHNLDKFVLQEGEEKAEAVFGSRASSDCPDPSNEFIRVVADDFVINMGHDYYENEKFTDDFHLRNIKEMQVIEIRESNGRLRIEAKATYTTQDQEELFPKIRVTTKYYSVDSRTDEDSVDSQTEEKNLLIEISNIGSQTSKSVKFEVWKEYKVKILIENLGFDNLAVKLIDKNCDDFALTRKGHHKYIETELGTDPFPYEYCFTVLPEGAGNTYECYTEMDYFRKEEEKYIFGHLETRKFKARISSDVGQFVNIKENGEVVMRNAELEVKIVNEGEIFTIEIEIEQPPEVSVPVQVYAFLIPDENLEIKGGDFYCHHTLEGGKPKPLTLRLEAPLISGGEKEMNCEVNVLVYYSLGNQYWDHFKNTKQIRVLPSTLQGVKEFLGEFADLGQYVAGSIFGLIIVLATIMDIRERTHLEYRKCIGGVLRPHTVICRLTGFDEESEEYKELQEKYGSPQGYRKLRQLSKDEIAKVAKDTGIEEGIIEKLNEKAKNIQIYHYAFSFWLIFTIILVIYKAIRFFI